MTYTLITIVLIYLIYLFINLIIKRRKDKIRQITSKSIAAFASMRGYQPYPEKILHDCNKLDVHLGKFKLNLLDLIIHLYNNGYLDRTQIDSLKIPIKIAFIYPEKVSFLKKSCLFYPKKQTTNLIISAYNEMRKDVYKPHYVVMMDEINFGLLNLISYLSEINYVDRIKLKQLGILDKIRKLLKNKNNL